MTQRRHAVTKCWGPMARPSLAAASDALHSERFDAAVLDLSSQDSSGLESLQTLIGVNLGVAIIVVSANSEDGVRQAALTLGAHEFLTKRESLSRTLWRSVVLAIERQRFQTQQLSERHQAEELRARGRKLEVSNREIMEASRLKTDFLAKMSHELGTPLNAIIGFAQLLHDGDVAPDSPQHQEFLGDILTSGHHLLNLINDVLDIAKVEAGRTAFRPEPVLLPRLMAEVCGALRSLASSKHIAVELETDPELTEVVIDRTRFRQILQNYLANALRFTPAHGRVSVRAMVESAELFRLEVADTGVGIAEADLPRIFVEFGQLLGSSDQHELGTGLGLAVTKRLVEAQGGCVGVRSQVGHGSVFHAILPRQAGTTSSAPLEAQHTSDLLGGVLIVDDNPHTRRIMAQTVSDLGYTAVYRSSGVSGLEAIRQLEPAAVIVDIVMPGGDPRTRDVRILAVTAAAMAGDDVRALAAGCDGYISKPIDTRLLPALVQDLLERSDGFEPNS
jgi:signal transduction histidine kinase